MDYWLLLLDLKNLNNMITYRRLNKDDYSKITRLCHKHEIQIPDTYEWYLAKMSSLLTEADFEYYQGMHIAHFRGNMLNKNGDSIGIIGLVKGQRLKGQSASIMLRNSKTNENPLLAVSIEYEKSM